MSRQKIEIVLDVRDFDTDLFIVRWDGQQHLYTPINRDAVEDKLVAGCIFQDFLNDFTDLPDVAEFENDDEE